MKEKLVGIGNAGGVCVKDTAERKRCIECGGFHGLHTDACRLQTQDQMLSVIRRLKRDLLRTLKMNRKTIKRLTNQATFWQGKFRIVAYENNKLRRIVVHENNKLRRRNKNQFDMITEMQERCGELQRKLKWWEDRG